MNLLTSKPMLYMACGLVISIIINLTLGFFFVRNIGKNISAAKIQDLNAQISGYETAKAVSTALSKISRNQQDELLKDLNDIATRGQKTKTLYRQAADTRPLGENCAPGIGRMDAINKALGPTKDAE